MQKQAFCSSATSSYKDNQSNQKPPYQPQNIGIIYSGHVLFCPFLYIRGPDYLDATAQFLVRKSMSSPSHVHAYTDCFCHYLQVSTFTVSCPTSLGKLVLIELDKQHLPFFPEDSWFPAKVEVKSPEGHTYSFPIYRWITDNEVHRFREGTGLWKMVCLTTEDRQQWQETI